MKKFRAFKLGRKLLKVFRCIIRPGSRNYRNFLLRSPTSDPGYIQLGEKGMKRVDVPKGNLAMYVSNESEGDTRVLVPVIYINHPIFEELLKDSERVYGFNHQSGGITLPCGMSEFEEVKMRIADWEHCRRKRRHRPCQ